MAAMPRAPWLAVTAALAACGSSRPRQVSEPAAGAYRATARWTSFGVPHVIADDLGGLGFGQGWVSAKQHLCRLADQLVRVRGERSRYFGPGDGEANLDSDFFHLHLGLAERARALRERMSSDARAIAAGWVAGYDHYLAVTPPGDWPEPCRGAAWVKPIDEDDLAMLDLGLATLASSRQFVEEIARAAPDAGARSAAGWPSRQVELASNGWALGADRTESGRGLLVANPHFPWEGDLTFQEIHLTVRGDLDVYGATIPGVPMVAIGFTRHHAWTHTFSSSTAFLIHRLRLAGDPLTYARDDATAPITGRRYTIDVRGADGRITKQSRTLYRCDLGPMVASPQMPWRGGLAWAFDDVALESAGSVIDLYLGFARAESLDGFRAATGHRATPFLNTIYADVDGDAWYVDGSAVADLSDDALAAWEAARKASPELAQAWRHGVAIVDGSTRRFDPRTEAADQPRIVPIDQAPELLRRDFVFNANDSYGLTNPAAPLAGASPLYGDATATPSLRSLANLRLLRERGEAAAAGSDGRFSRPEAAAALLSSRSFTGEQLRDDVLARCNRAARTRKRLQVLCTRLAEWDLRLGVDSRGAALWRELMQQLAVDGDLPWKVPFDPAQPATPSGLALGDAAVIAALERAADLLARAGIDVRAGSSRLGDVQRAAIGSRAPVPGGDRLDGVANVVGWKDGNGTLLPHATRDAALSPTGLGPGGYPINYGTSWVMVVDLERGGPEADVLLTYGPGDQLALFGRRQLRHALFEDEEIRADPDLVVEDISSGGTP